MEDLLIRKVKGGINGIKNGTKDATEIAPLLNKLKDLNEGMYDELVQEYKIGLEKRKH
jgi:hypothetical protein